MGQKVLLNITGGANLGLLEVNEAAELISSAADPEAIIIFGAVIDENLHDELRITVIATGFENVKGKSLEIEDFEVGHFMDEDLDIPAFLRRNRKK